VPTSAIEVVDETVSEAMSCTMFVADFASQFSKTLALKPVTYQELNAAINAEGLLDGRDVLWDLYEGLMRFLLNVRTDLQCLCPEPLADCQPLQTYERIPSANEQMTNGNCRGMLAAKCSWAGLMLPCAWFAEHHRSCGAEVAKLLGSGYLAGGCTALLPVPHGQIPGPESDGGSRYAFTICFILRTSYSIT
jgi:hypothetical protein